MNAPAAPTLPDRFRGCLLGLAVGDALGAPFESLPADVIFHDFGGPRAIVDRPPVDGPLVYTDDTQMTIGVAETLIAHGRIDQEALAAAFLDNYQPDRGYGPGARRLLELMGTGGDWRTAAQTMFPGGSLGNGAAMRAAPVGLLFHDDPDRAWHEAGESALPTHTHPIGIEGARLVALAVALAVRGGPAFDRAAFYAELIARATTDEFRWQLAAAAKVGPRDSFLTFGSRLEAHRSVVTAIECFTVEPDSYRGVIGRAIALGHDTDTVAAMAGAIAGARLGLAAVPAHLLGRLENGDKGRDYIEALALALCDRCEMDGHAT